MKIDCKPLRAALSGLSAICGKRSPIPLASYVRLQTTEGALQLLCANGEAQSEQWAECEGELSDMACVNHRTFCAMLPGSGSVDISLNSGVLSIKSGDSVRELPSTDWSAMPLFNLASVGEMIRIDCVELSSCIRFCSFAAGSNAGFPHAGILHVKKSRAEAADGRIIAFAPLKGCESDLELCYPTNLRLSYAPFLRRKTPALSGMQTCWLRRPRICRFR